MRHARPIETSLILGALTIAFASGCASECKQIRAEFEQLERQQGEVATTKMIKANAPEVLGVSVRASVVERMISTAVVERAKPMAKTVKLGRSRLVTHVELVDLDLLPLGKCEDCLRFSASMKIDAQLLAGPVSMLKTHGRAKVEARVPLVLESGRRGSTLLVDLSRARIEDVDLQVADLPRAATKPLGKLVRGGARQALTSFGRKVKVMQWDPVKVEGSAVRLLASRIAINPKDQTLWVGFKSNLREPGSPVSQAAELHEGEDLSATFSGTLMTAVLRSMMASGTIHDRLDDDLKPDPKGSFRVRLGSVTPTDDGLLTDFSVWRLPDAGGTCYVAHSRGLATVRPHRRGDKLKIKINDIQIVETHGDDTLLDIGLWANSVFMRDAIEAQTTVLSAKRFELGGAGELEMKIARVGHTEGSISVFSKLIFVDKAKH